MSAPKKIATRKRKLRPQQIAQARCAELERNGGDDLVAIRARAKNLATADVVKFLREVDERMVELDDF